MSVAKTFFIYFMTTYSTFPIWSVFADVFNKFTLAIKLVAFCHVLAPPILSEFHLPRQYVASTAYTAMLTMQYSEFIVDAYLLLSSSLKNDYMLNVACADI